MKLTTLFLAVASAIASHNVYAINNQQSEEASSTEVIEVRSIRQQLQDEGRLKDVIQQTEVLSQLDIETKHAMNLSDAIANEPGVRVSNECSMCGVKRIMLNGMKGEHTTILIDGLPTHTLISGFYAVDAAATAGVERIEIARGAGASLIAPEAIGGTLNIISKNAFDNSVSLDFSKGTHDFTALQAVATGVSEDGKTGITVTGQFDTQEQEDHDNNGVSEVPFTANRSISAVISHDLTDNDNVKVRYANIKGEIFGGPVIGEITSSIGETIATFDGIDSESLFTNDDVNEQYIGKPWETAEWIDTAREEFYVKWLRNYSDTLIGEFAYSTATHLQDSFYEGIDYQADDTMHYLRAKFDLILTNDIDLSVGGDYRSEEMRSNSEALDSLDDYVSDSFDYHTAGLFAQLTWVPNDDLELALAARVDSIEADFIDPSKDGVEIEETFFAPRLDARWFHTENLSSRFSIGRGYRAPLSFFETDHGILDTALGYEIDVNELEKSLSSTYVLSFEGEALNWALSLAHSQVENLASLEESDSGVPILSQLADTASVSTIDMTTDYTINENWNVSGSFELFKHNQAFKESYAIAPLEERLGLDLNYSSGKFSSTVSWIWFGSRDLNEYAYEGFDIAGDTSSVKPLTAPSHSIVHAQASYELAPEVEVYLGVQNLFDYTQVGEGDSPLFFDADGGYDVGYIWGPLHGSDYYVGIRVAL